MMQQSFDELMMRRAMELATLGRGNVSPNPLVGCVIACEGEIIGEGYHEQYGQAHAEVNAIAHVRDPQKLSQSTLYVSLEPCSHYGNTPPCADLIVQHQIPRVLISNQDPNPVVAGRGIARLRQAGIEVQTGLLASEGETLNRRFFTFMRKKRPYIILKWAETADGFLARENYDSKWISDAHSRLLVHKWRAEEDAIMVGTNTAFYDNPRLNVRDWSGRNPVRILLDRNLRVPTGHAIFDNSQLTICYNLHRNDHAGQNEFVRLDSEAGLSEILSDLFLRKIQSVIVEGGAALLQSFFAAGLWDEARIFKSPEQFGKGIPAPKPLGTLTSLDTLVADQLFFYQNLGDEVIS